MKRLYLCLFIVAAVGCDIPPDDEEGDPRNGMEIETVEQAALTDPNVVKKWKLQSRKRDVLITGTNASNKLIFRAHVQRTNNHDGNVMTITRPTVTLVSTSKYYKKAWKSREIDAKTGKLVEQFQKDAKAHRNGLQSQACVLASAACAIGIVKIFMDVYLRKPDNLPTDIPAGAVACTATALACTWIDVVETMGSGQVECMDRSEAYGIPLGCTTVPF